MSGVAADCDLAEHAAARAEQPDTVLLLHGSASSSAVWRRTIDALRPLYRTVAPDLIGYGGARPWLQDAPYDLNAEVKALGPLLPCCAVKYHLVGYSYGGVVALQLALANPVQVRTLTLIEPVFFAALRYTGETAAYEAFGGVRDKFVATLAGGDRETAMREFIDFWSGSGAWAALSAAVREAMLEMANRIVLDWEASFAVDPGADRLKGLGHRTLLVRGDASPAPMCALVDALHELMPGSEQIVVPGANHLLPLTHSAALVNAIMAQLHGDAERRLR